MLALNAVAEQIVDFHIVAQIIKSHQRPLRMFGFGENAHTVCQIGIQNRRYAVLGVKYAHIPFRMLGGHLCVDAFCRIGIAEGQCRLSCLEAFRVVLGIDNGVFAPESFVLPALQALNHTLELRLIVNALHFRIVVRFADAAHCLPCADSGYFFLRLPVRFLPHAVKHKELVVIGAYIQGNQSGLVCHDGIHVGLRLVQGCNGLDTVFIHQIAPCHVHIGSNLLVVHGKHKYLSVYLCLLPGLRINACRSHGRVSVKRFLGNLPESLLGGLGIAETPVSRIDDVPVFSGSKDQRIFLLIFAPAHELHINGGIDFRLQFFVDFRKHLVVVHGAVSDEVHGQGHFLGDIGAFRLRLRLRR